MVRAPKLQACTISYVSNQILISFLTKSLPPPPPPCVFAETPSGDATKQKRSAKKRKTVIPSSCTSIKLRKNMVTLLTWVTWRVLISWEKDDVFTNGFKTKYLNNWYEWHFVKLSFTWISRLKLKWCRCRWKNHERRK